MTPNNSPLSASPGNLPKRSWTGRCRNMFTMGGFFYRTLTAPAQETLRTTVQAHYIPYAILSGRWVRKAIAGKDTHIAITALSREAVTVNGTSHILAKHREGAKIRICMKDCRYRLHVALLAKVRCRGLAPLLNHTSMTCVARQA